MPQAADDYLVRETRSILEKLGNRKGHDLCHYEPEAISSLLTLYGIEVPVDLELPPVGAFRQGCRQMERQLYSIGEILRLDARLLDHFLTPVEKPPSWLWAVICLRWPTAWKLYQKYRHYRLYVQAAIKFSQLKQQEVRLRQAAIRAGS